MSEAKVDLILVQTSFLFVWKLCLKNISLHKNDTIYTIIYLPTFSESNAWDFHLVMTGISRNIPATSKDFWQLSKDFRTFPKLSADVPKMFEHFWSYLRDDNLSMIWFCKEIKKAFLDWIFINTYHVLKNNLSGFVSQVWEIVLNAWDWCL